MIFPLLLALPVALALPTSGGVKVPLGNARRSNEHAVAKYGLSQRSLSIADEGDYLYYGNGTVGTAHKGTFQFLFDTGSSDVFLPSKACPSSQCGGEKYNEKGTNLKKTIHMSYGSGEVYGNMWKDTVSVNGLAAENQVFVATDFDSLLSSSNANGIIGMGFQQNSKTNGTLFFQNLINQKKVKTPEFGVYYGRNAAGPAKVNSELTLGGRDPTRFTGGVYEVPVVDEYYWTVDLPDVAVNGKCVSNFSSGGKAAIDTGTQNIVAPIEHASAIYAAIPGAGPASSTDVPEGDVVQYYLPCNTPQQYMPSLAFGGEAFAIDRADLIAGPADAPPLGGKKGTAYCMSNLVGADMGDPKLPKLWVVGDVFLRSWYTIYSYKGKGGKPSVSFARAVHGAKV